MNYEQIKKDLLILHKKKLQALSQMFPDYEKANECLKKIQGIFDVLPDDEIKTKLIENWGEIYSIDSITEINKILCKYESEQEKKVEPIKIYVTEKDITVQPEKKKTLTFVSSSKVYEPEIEKLRVCEKIINYEGRSFQINYCIDKYGLKQGALEIGEGILKADGQRWATLIYYEKYNNDNQDGECWFMNNTYTPELIEKLKEITFNTPLTELLDNTTSINI